MPVGSDFTINTTAKTVTHSSGTEVYTVLAFFQWLATTFAATGYMDDDYPFVSDTPQVYRWTNSWDMGDETSYQFLKGGAVATSDYVANTSGKLFANVYSIGSQFRDSMIYMIQNDAEVSPWWSPGNIDVLVKVDDSGYIASGIVTVKSRDTDVLYDHNDADLSAGGRNPVGVNTAEDLNYKSSTTVFVGDIYLDVAAVTNFDIGNFAYGVTSTASGRINGIDTTNGYLYLCQVEGTFQTSESIVERATRGGSNLDGSTTNHATTAEYDVVRGYSDVVPLFVQRKFTGDTTQTGWTDGEVLNQASSGWAGKFIADAGDILYVQNTSGTPDNTGDVVGVSSSNIYTPTATSAQTTVPKDLNNGAGAVNYNVVIECASRTMTQVYRYLKYAVAHNSTLTINGDAGEEYRSASEPTYAEVKQAPFGSFAGGTFFGARGVWVQNYAAAAFQLTDATGTQQLPPNYQIATVSHTDLSGCYILIAERSGANIIKNQYTISSVTSNSITVTTTIDGEKVPQSGSLRVGDTVYTYTSFATTIFSGVSPDPTGETGDLYVPILDVLADATSESSAQLILANPISVKIRVRKYGFKDYTVDGSFPTTGLTVTPILATDPQAT